MGLMHVAGLIAVAGLLALGLIALRRAPRDPIARVLALLVGDLALWNLATVLFGATGEPAWHWLDVTFSPFTPPLVLHLVTTWVGVARRARPWLVASYAAFGALALSSFAAWFFDWARAWLDSAAWSIVYLAGWFPIMAASLVLLWREIGRRREVPEAANRARLLFAAILVAGLLGSTELWDDLFDVPALGVLGTLVATTLVATVVLRFGLFARRERLAVAVYVGLMAFVLGVVLAAIATATGGHTGATLISALLVFAILLVILRELAQSAAVRRARTLELASLGRFTAQMAHDLKNPLAALKGAIQYLQVAPAPASDSATFLELMSQQVARIEVILERYARLAQTRIAPAPLAVGALAAEVARALVVAVDGVRLELATDAVDAVDVGPWRGDRDLLASAFENVVRNALQAMPGGGTLAVRARRDGAVVTITFEDTGAGIDPRYLDHVAADFFTTRADGSGLGLAFVRRIAAAHGGALAVASELGRGTLVTLTLVSQDRPSLESPDGPDRPSQEPPHDPH